MFIGLISFFIYRINKIKFCEPCNNDVIECVVSQADFIC